MRNETVGGRLVADALRLGGVDSFLSAFLTYAGDILSQLLLIIVRSQHYEFLLTTGETVTK